MERHQNNFDFLRLLFATFVIITHSYTLTGLKECDILCQISNGQMGFSYIGVKGFFIISGYLIFQSLQRSSTILQYFWKRILRIYPALIVVLLLTVLLVPFVYQSSVPFFQNTQLLKYLPQNLTLYKPQYGISGVFESNPHKAVINGSLWTLPFEFTMYLFIIPLFVFRKKTKLASIILFFVLIASIIAILFFEEKVESLHLILSGFHLFDLGCFFLAGSFWASVEIEKFNHKKTMLLAAFVTIIIATYFNFFNEIKYVVLPFLIILLGLIPVRYIKNIGYKLGDLSYGVYIYAYPVQQTLLYFYKLNHVQLMFCTIIISFILAYFSWHIVEKRALKLKNIPLNLSK
ncbi:MAG: acyltransferase [Flavobacteriales bacterium]|nr:acyltransferase [Flavobacteriales bacterium]